MIYICTQTINTSHYGTEKDRTYNIASDCFWYNRNHWCFSPPDRTTLWLGRVQQQPYFRSMFHYHGGNLPQSANTSRSTPITNNREGHCQIELIQQKDSGDINFNRTLGTCRKCYKFRTHHF